MKEGDYATACGWLVRIKQMPIPNTELGRNEVALVLLIMPIDRTYWVGSFYAGALISLYLWRLKPFSRESAELAELAANLG